MPDQELYAMRHSLAHIMATAIQHLYPTAKFGIGPVVENGFYYDIDIDDVKLTSEDFKSIEAEMRKVIKADTPFQKVDMNIDQAITWAQEKNQPYKEELLNDLKRAGTTMASQLNPASHSIWMLILPIYVEALMSFQPEKLARSSSNELAVRIGAAKKISHKCSEYMA
jgi:threonyl-tRNA synthetase